MSPKVHNISKSVIWQGESRSEIENVVDTARNQADETIQARTGRFDDTVPAITQRPDEMAEEIIPKEANKVRQVTKFQTTQATSNLRVQAEMQ